MKISSKSILSPGRTDKYRDPAAAAVSSLSASLSRRLRTNGSLRSSGSGQASPMFPKKRGGGRSGGPGFENPEPSSPKVTCIGQVRVKTKKKKAQARKKNQQLRSRSQRRGGGGGEVSFRRIDRGNRSQRERNNNSQRWVHLPLTICEALRAFGAEFNCFLPCRSSCASDKEKAAEAEMSGGIGCGRGGGGSGDGGSTSCGAAIARWLVAMQDGEGGGKRREIEAVVKEEGDDETDGEGEDAIRRCRRRLGIEEEMEAAEGRDLVMETAGEGEGVSVCVPPKNALLLMRCRSDPVRMSALASRLWEASVTKNEIEEEDEEENNADIDDSGGEKNNAEEERIGGWEKVGTEGELELNLEAARDHHQQSEDLVSDEFFVVQDHNNNDLVVALAMEEEEGSGDEDPVTNTNPAPCTAMEEAKTGKEEAKVEESPEPIQAGEESKADATLSETEVDDQKLLDIEHVSDKDVRGEEDDDEDMVHDEEGRDTVEVVYVRPEKQKETASVSEGKVAEGKQEEKARPEALKEESEELSIVEAEQEEAPETHECDTKSGDPEPKGHKKSEGDDNEGDEEEEEEEEIHQSQNAEEAENQRLSDPNPKRDESSPVLPDSLLLMMREPKLSMEVSKETWVCKRDFIRCLPQRVNPINGRDEPQKKRLSVDSDRPPRRHIQPPRSSCSIPAASAGDASMATMIEQRLVSAAAYEPLVLTRCKSEPVRSTAKLAPDSCFWKTRKLEAAPPPPPQHHQAAEVGF